MDAERARRLTELGAALLLLDMPQGTSLGLDNQMLVTGPKFKGIKMVPPGCHFVYYRVGEAAPVRGYFVHLDVGEVHVRRWSPLDEALAPLEDEDEASRFAVAVTRHEFDGGMGAYDLATRADWHCLSCWITPEVADRARPAGGADICVADEPDPGLAAPATPAEHRLADQLAAWNRMRRAGPPGGPNPPADDGRASSVVSRGAFYAPVPRLVSRRGATPEELTALNVDKSAALTEILTSHYGGLPESLLGEWQHAYLAAVLGHSLLGLQQWGRLTGLLLACRAGVLGAHARLFARALPTLGAQLRAAGARGGEGLLLGEDVAVAGLAPLRRALMSFLVALHDPPRGGGETADADAVRAAGMALERDTGWGGVEEIGEDGDDDDEQPVVVDLGEA